MKTANFKWSSKPNSRPIYGKVTLKNDGKTSISLFDVKYGTSAAERYQAKLLANEIVKMNFNHPAAYGVVEQNSPAGLVAALTEKTADFKKLYIEKVKAYAKSYFEYCEKKLKRTRIEWFEAFSIEYEIVPYKYGRVNDSWPKDGQGRKERNMDSEKSKCQIVVSGGFEKFEKDEVKKAERHYADSIEKLAYRLNQKGIVDGSQFVIKSAMVDVNLTITIEHGNEITKAWTIIAEGPIQRPHYRYLVK